MEEFIRQYIEQQKSTLDSIPADQINVIIAHFKKALDEEKNIFVFGNGGSAANASHFVTDLGKGSSDKTHKRFRCMSLNDNTAWLTALGNDYSYDDVFLRQIMNFARPGDLLFTMSVSGNSMNLVKAMQWGRENNLITISLVGNNRGKLADISDVAVIVNDGHYGRVEDAHMGICHMIAYAFMENRALQR